MKIPTRKKTWFPIQLINNFLTLNFFYYEKLKKLTLKEVIQQMPVIGSIEARMLLGGTGCGYTGSMVSESTMEQMMEDGIWQGGQVIGMGYVGSQVTVSGSDLTDSTATESTPSEPIISEAEMENMMNEGTWQGGFVENMGYVTQQTSVFNGNGDYGNLSDFASEQTNDAVDSFANWALGVIDVTNVSDLAIERINNLKWKAMENLLSQGVTNDKPLYWDMINTPKNSEIRFYDGTTGNELYRDTIFPE